MSVTGNKVVLRSFKTNDAIKIDNGWYPAYYTVSLHSVEKGGREARRLHIDAIVPAKDGILYSNFTADAFIPYFITNKPKGPLADSFGAVQKVANEYVTEELKDKTAMFPISIIFQIVLFLVMELYRYWRDKRRYEELENTFRDTIITYNDNEYLEAEGIDWNV